MKGGRQRPFAFPLARHDNHYEEKENGRHQVSHDRAGPEDEGMKEAMDAGAQGYLDGAAAAILLFRRDSPQDDYPCLLRHRLFYAATRLSFQHFFIPTNHRGRKSIIMPMGSRADGGGARRVSHLVESLEADQGVRYRALQ